MMARRLEGKVVIVTGGGSGLGREIVEVFARQGARVAVVDIDGYAAGSVAAGTALAAPFQADVSDRDSVDRMLVAAVASLGEPDILVHSAGIGLERAFLATTLEDWRRVVDVDLTGTFNCCQAVAARMVEAARQGSIITLASTAGVRGGEGRAAYGAAKGGVILLTRVMAVELAAFGIRVNALAPGAIDTALVASMHSARTRTVYRRAIPMDRYGEPSEVAGAALFLASEDASYVTGHVLAVDGGFLGAGLIMHAPER